jgi:hypothetical protein
MIDESKLAAFEGMFERIAVSFSGGRSSAVAADLIWRSREKWGDVQMCFVNTGEEAEETLDFVKACQEYHGWPLVWLEPVVDPELGKGIRHRVVTYETATRQNAVNGPFEQYIAKHGIPGPTNPNCTNYLKEECMNAYRRDALGWKRGTYATVIGIRADEMDRVRDSDDFLYPLVITGHTRPSVNARVRSWGFDLQIPNDAHGNCVWCWKKSLRKLITVAQQAPEVFDFPMRMEQKYKRHRQSEDQDDRLFFRNRMTTQDILDLSQNKAKLQEMNFHPYTDDAQLTIFDQIGWDEFLDTGGGCGDSCEIGADY